MKTINITASRNYDVIIGNKILPQLAQYMQNITNAEKVCIVSDSNVFPIYGEIVYCALQVAGYNVIHYVFPAGESSKNGSVYLDLLNFLAENQITRSDCLIALGGGVVGDLTGFAAATYLRGIDYIQIPTTLLAMVDSSVGGKTAIDLPAGKNLCGAFYQPALVLCDIETLDSLPSRVFFDGCAEVIKYGILIDRELFDHLQDCDTFFAREEVIARCIELKRDIVAQDEFDRGLRMKLNLGHTIGHGIEKCSGYAITHGSAVAAGIAIVTRAARTAGLCANYDADRILQLLHSFQLPTKAEFDAQALMDAALSDKKRNGDIVNLIIPRRIGECDIYSIQINELKSFIEAGLL